MPKLGNEPMERFIFTLPRSLSNQMKNAANERELSIASWLRAAVSRALAKGIAVPAEAGSHGITIRRRVPAPPTPVLKKKKLKKLKKVFTTKVKSKPSFLVLEADPLDGGLPERIEIPREKVRKVPEVFNDDPEKTYVQIAHEVGMKSSEVKEMLALMGATWEPEDYV